ncbi:sulfatase [Planctomicrobium sp. SH664]|uniref:sulfatase n=1 Tax=Planctomicrobium sp. SH664 TaxID=3448125 RepID=UPI003F5AE0DB
MRFRIQLLSFLCCLLVCISSRAAEKLNVLFLMADDLNCDLGCYGNTRVKSPNLDALAASGVRFEHAYCQFPLCGPSRASLLTGRRPNETQILRNARSGRFGRDYTLTPHLRETIPDTVTLPQLFIENGYAVGRVGKLYHYGVPGQIGTDGLDDVQSWQFVVNPAGRDKADEPQIFTIGKDRNFGGMLSWLAAEGTDAEQTDGIGANAAIRLLEANRDKPFFLAFGCFRPHTPYVSPKKYFDMYPKEAIQLPELSEDDRNEFPALAYAGQKPEQRQLNDDQRRSAIQAYSASISFMDAQVGRVLKSLDELGLRDKTIVVFASDHGYHMGEHGLWQKMSLFENAAHVPLIISAPGMKGNGHVATTMAELVDLYPTLAQLCGLTAPDYIDGVSLVPVLENPQVQIKEIAYTQVERGQSEGVSLRTTDWRYTLWGGGADGEQLFEIGKDPGEMKNVAADPQHAAVVAKFKELALKYQSNRPTPKPDQQPGQKNRRPRAGATR